MTKSETIRRYISKHPDAKAPEILAALRKSRVSVSLPLIYQQLAKASGELPATRTKSSKPSGKEVSVASLLEAKKLVARAGSVAQAEKALDILKQLTS